MKNWQGLLCLIMLGGGMISGVYFERHRVREMSKPVSTGVEVESLGVELVWLAGDDESTMQILVYEPTIEDLLDAIEWVESLGDPDAVGKAGEIGTYQITKQYVDDVNRIIRVLSMGIPYFTYDDRWDRTSSREMTSILTGFYSTGFDVYRFEARARIHNAGPDGWRNDPRWFVRNRGYTIEEAVVKINNSLVYWELVKSAMEGGNE